MADFEYAVTKLLAAEGGFASQDNTAGAVKYGITARFLRSIGLPSSTEDVARLTVADACSLYRDYFWDFYHVGKIVDQQVAELLLFSVVNMAPVRAVRFLQEAANKLGSGLQVDGRVGPRTLGVLNGLSDPDRAVLVWNYKQLLEGWYRYLARSNPALYADDLPGWLNRLKSV